ncbi:PRC-barrel domain-containing protein [Leisingera thetidis]|uniref:PRC-barrel domain-containing protein n=1 Tax=Leisingera thetidis TaxID=2930199 RepID=UPI0021F7474C|nr:PRC-barrel domain-containing protein [Leisingera thetidis]
MKHLLLSTSLIAAAAMPAFAGTEADLSGSAEAGVQLETPAAEASGEASAMGEAKAETAPLQPETEELMDDAANAADSISDAIDPDADAPVMEPLGEVELTADALTGARTYDANDEHIGEVSQVIVNTSGGVEAVIIDVGGFLGIGEKPVELSMGDLDVRKLEGDIRVTTHLTREQMEALPDYQPG